MEVDNHMCQKSNTRLRNKAMDKSKLEEVKLQVQNLGEEWQCPYYYIRFSGTDSTCQTNNPIALTFFIHSC